MGQRAAEKEAGPAVGRRARGRKVSRAGLVNDPGNAIISLPLNFHKIRPVKSLEDGGPGPSGALRVAGADGDTRKTAFLRRLSGAAAESGLFRGARRLVERNRADWTLPFGRIDNLVSCAYLVLSDYAAGAFPPACPDRATVHESERRYGQDLGGVSEAEFRAKEIRKPFWDAKSADLYLNGFVRLLSWLESYGLAPGSRILELGCGSGWTAEFLALAGYDVVATTIAPADIEAVESRAAALRARGVPASLAGRVSAMESVDDVVAPRSFDGAYVHQALHHAHDWRAALAAAFRTLRPGGWMFIADEPNVLHTFLAYRVAKMTGTHEIGMRRSEIVPFLRQTGYREVRAVAPKLDDRLHPHWIAARR